mmetsp:Transcript_36819/g.83718  ORF Transcript_36819/g.83718 Transcript_36819/m.83718 type:complete len:103 (+) Transcript_36819:30-338(+)|eukprot:CAMPEP_0180245462 /NCGR_PEP_ID=MMETSP0987-20121128/35019_1 /TAXON_ID=697907 /ORGANISM="non described non described, Strain CCMP2293" /LENGTH=102 /DNA_ID=CAMNT_0022213143 /DNA_START=18 /DNA_END=326 /DNA_ORIENTATION=+
MDFGTVRTRLENETYTSEVQFVADVQLTLSNAMEFNPQGHWAYDQAMELKVLFDALWIESSLRLEINKSERAMQEHGMSAMDAVQEEEPTYVPNQGRRLFVD